MTKKITSQDDNMLLKIHKFITSDDFIKLEANRKRKSFLHIIAKDRSENINSNLLAWVLSCEDFYKHHSPVLTLLRLIVQKSLEIFWGNPQGKSLGKILDKDIQEEILVNSVDVNLRGIKREFKASDINKNHEDRIDLAIACELKSKTKKSLKKVRIFIENKIDSKENKNQCSKYYNYFTKHKGFPFPDACMESEADCDIFCFLSTQSNPEIGNPNFIVLTHQDIYDVILLPLYEIQDSFSHETSFYLREFVNALTSLNTQGRPIIAFEKSVYRLIKRIYENYKDLIDYSVELGTSSDEIKKAVKEKRKKRYRITPTNPNMESCLSDPTNLSFNFFRLLKINKNFNYKSISKHFSRFFAEEQVNTSYTKSLKILSEEGEKEIWINTQMMRKDNYLKDLIKTARKEYGYKIEKVEVTDKESEEEKLSDSIKNLVKNFYYQNREILNLIVSVGSEDEEISKAIYYPQKVTIYHPAWNVTNKRKVGLRPLLAEVIKLCAKNMDDINSIEDIKSLFNPVFEQQDFIGVHNTSYKKDKLVYKNNKEEEVFINTQILQKDQSKLMKFKEFMKDLGFEDVF